MSTLLRFELRKLFRAKILYVSFIVLLAGILLQGLIYFLMGEMIGIMDVYSYDTPSIVSAEQFMVSALGAGLTGIALAIFISVFTTGDFGNGVMKNIVAKGYSRESIFFAKFLAAVIFSFGIGVVGIIFGGLFGLIFDHADSVSAIIIPQLLVQVLCVVAFGAFLYFLAMLLKRSGLAVALSIVAVYVMQLVTQVIDLIIQSILYEMGKYEVTVSISKYWIGGTLTSISSLNVDAMDLVVAGIIACCYIGLSICLGFLAFRKREV